MQEIWRWSNLGLMFAVELAGLGIFAWWGWQTGASTPIKLLLVIALPVVAAVVWGLFAAPTANYRSPVVTTIVKLAFFALAGLALWSLDHWLLGTIFVLVVAANALVIRLGHITA
jgi:hypothetical protein